MAICDLRSAIIWKPAFRITFATNGKRRATKAFFQFCKNKVNVVVVVDRNNHVTMFILYLFLAVLSFSAELSTSFALTSKARIVLHYSHKLRKHRHKHESDVCL